MSHQWLVLWLIWLSSRAPQHGRGSASKSEALREADYVEVRKMAEDSSEVVKEAMEASAASDVMVKSNGPAFLQNISYQSAVNFQQAMNAELLGAVGLNQAARTKAIDMLLNTSAQEGISDSAIAGIMAKVMGNTPPVTP